MMAKLRAEGMLSVSERRVQFIDIKALEVLAHFQAATLSRIPESAQKKQELIA
jgi:hypothetical protein